MHDLSNYPFQEIDSKYEINPKGIIQLSLSRLRESRCSDAELANYIARFLGIMMNKNNLIIDTEDCIVLSFKSKQP